MSNTTKIFMTILLVLAAGAGSACAEEQKPPIQVAVSVYNTEPAFMRKWLADLNRHPAVLDGRVKLHVFNCTGSHAFQHMHFEAISTMRYDAVIVAANDFRASRNLRIDGIIAENDEMALGALEALKRNGMAAVPAASIDGLPDAVDAVRRGELLQTLRQDSALQAQGALDLALRAVLGGGYSPESPAWNEELLAQWEAERTAGTQRRYIVPWEVISKCTERRPASPPASDY